jgi:exopolysaccharide biosynthesis protein
MNPSQEIEKIASIIKAKKFEYKGAVYALDMKATDSARINANLDGKPIRKFIGHDKDDNTVIVWSHDVKVVESHVIAKVIPAKVVVTSTLDEPVKTETPKKKKKPSWGK